MAAVWRAVFFPREHAGSGATEYSHKILLLLWCIFCARIRAQHIHALLGAQIYLFALIYICWPSRRR